MATNLSVHGSDDTSFRDCDVCTFQNVTSEAVSYCATCIEYLCKTCDKAHRGSKLTRNHTILMGSNIPSASTKTHPTSSTIFCEDHTTMIVDMYCTSHSEVICSACKITSHGMCKITDLSQQTKQMKKHGSFEETMTHLKDLKSMYDNVKATRKKDKSSFKAHLEKCREDMHQIRKEINETLDTIDNTLSKEIQHADERMTKEAEGHIAIFDEILSKIMEKLKNLEICEKAQDGQLMFVGMRRASIAQHKYADTLDKMQQDIHQLQSQFKINDTLYDAIKQMQSVEKVLVDRQKSLLNMSISGRRDIDIGDTRVFGCTFMPDGHLVLACGDKGLKLLDKDFKIKSQLNECAYRIAVINDNEIIATQGINQQMKTVELFPKMKVCKILKMNTNCKGVDVFGGEIYMTSGYLFAGNGEVQVLNMDGQVQRRLGLNNDKCMFPAPENVTVNNDGSKVFVSDHVTHTVTCLDTQGHVIYEYSDKDLKYPHGMYVDCDGYLLVCDNSSNNVHVIGQEGIKENILLSEIDGVKNPTCLAFRQSDGCLVVGSHNNKNNKPLITFNAKYV